MIRRMKLQYYNRMYVAISNDFMKLRYFHLYEFLIMMDRIIIYGMAFILVHIGYISLKIVLQFFFIWVNKEFCSTCSFWDHWPLDCEPSTYSSPPRKYRYHVVCMDKIVLASCSRHLNLFISQTSSCVESTAGLKALLSRCAYSRLFLRCTEMYAGRINDICTFITLFDISNKSKLQHGCKTFCTLDVSYPRRFYPGWTLRTQRFGRFVPKVWTFRTQVLVVS